MGGGQTWTHIMSGPRGGREGGEDKTCLVMLPPLKRFCCFALSLLRCVFFCSAQKKIAFLVI